MKTHATTHATFERLLTLDRLSSGSHNWKKMETNPKTPTAPSSEPGPRVGHIHLRVMMDTKSRWVRAARQVGKTLGDWMIEACNREAGKDQK